MKLKTGQVIEITGYIFKLKGYGTTKTKLIEFKYPSPVKALLLGKSMRYTGTLSYAYYGDYNANYLTDIEPHKVWMVMEIVENNNYRKPIPVFEHQISQGE